MLHGLSELRTKNDKARVADEHIEKDGINRTGGPVSDDMIEASLSAVCIESDDANTRNSSDANNTGYASAPRRNTMCCPHPRLFEPRDFYSKYTVINPVIGKGSTSYVMEIAKKSSRRSSISLGERSYEKSPLRNEVATSTNYACKVIKMRGFDQALGESSSSAAAKLKTFEQGAKLESVQMELRAMMALESHPSILKLHDVVWSVSTRECFLVTELARGGTLATALEMRGELQESLAKEVMLQVLDGVAFMHHHGLAHRDLKLENILLMEPDEFGMGSVKISDFGLTKLLTSGDTDSSGNHFESEHSICGSPLYIAPEMLDTTQDNGTDIAKYGLKIDIWACGIVLFQLLSGKNPFGHAKGIYTLFAAIKAGDYSVSTNEWQHVSREAQDFVKLLLQVDPVKRPTAEEVFGSAWLARSDSPGSSSRGRRYKSMS